MDRLSYVNVNRLRRTCLKGKIIDVCVTTFVVILFGSVLLAGNRE